MLSFKAKLSVDFLNSIAPETTHYQANKREGEQEEKQQIKQGGIVLL